MPTKPTKRRAGKRAKVYYRAMSDWIREFMVDKNLAAASVRAKTIAARGVSATVYKLVPVRVVRGRKP